LTGGGAPGVWIGSGSVIKNSAAEVEAFGGFNGLFLISSIEN
jgi:hypothetical protein